MAYRYNPFTERVDFVSSGGGGFTLLNEVEVENQVDPFLLIDGLNISAGMLKVVCYGYLDCSPGGRIAILPNNLTSGYLGNVRHEVDLAASSHVIHYIATIGLLAVIESSTVSSYVHFDMNLSINESNVISSSFCISKTKGEVKGHGRTIYHAMNLSDSDPVLHSLYVALYDSNYFTGKFKVYQIF